MLVLLSLALLTAVGDEPVKDAAKPKKDKLVCRSMETTGSRMGSAPVCKTTAQWEADAELTRKTMQFRERRNGM